MTDSTFHIDVPIDPNLISISEAATILGVSTTAVDQKTGKELTKYKLGAKFLRYDRREVEQLAARRAASK